MNKKVKDCPDRGQNIFPQIDPKKQLPMSVAVFNREDIRLESAVKNRCTRKGLLKMND